MSWILKHLHKIFKKLIHHFAALQNSPFPKSVHLISQLLKAPAPNGIHPSQLLESRTIRYNASSGRPVSQGVESPTGKTGSLGRFFLLSLKNLIEPTNPNAVTLCRAEYTETSAEMKILVFSLWR